MLNSDLVTKYFRPITPIPTDLKQTGNLEKMIKCVILDVYGTLFISESGEIGIAKKKAIKSERFESLFLKYEINRTSFSLLTDLFSTIERRHSELREKGIDFPEVEIDQIWMQILRTDNLEKIREFAIEYEFIVNPVYPMPNLKELILECRRREVLMGIISNGQFYTPYLFQWFLGSDLKQLGFCPELVFFSYQFARAKPSGFLFKKATESLMKMGVPAETTLYVGNDMLNDIHPAKHAGFKTALFAGDARSLRLRKNDSRCKNLSSDLVITDLLQLLKFMPS